MACLWIRGSDGSADVGSIVRRAIAVPRRTASRGLGGNPTGFSGAGQRPGAASAVCARDLVVATPLARPRARGGGVSGDSCALVCALHRAQWNGVFDRLLLEASF